MNLVFATSSGDNKPIMALSKSIDSDPEVVIHDLSSENITFAAILPVPEKKNLRYLLIFSKKSTSDKNDPILIQYNQDSLTELLKPVLDASKMTLSMYLCRQCAIMGFELLDYYNFSPFKPFVVEAYQKSKEGLLYFLPNHIIFGFRKPILLFHAQAIESILYSSITRITFSITLVLQSDEKCEFSMIDQKEYEKIDRYVKTKDFRDNSMTEELKAKNKMKNNEHSGALLEAAKMVPGAGNIVGEESDDSEDENYQFGNESEGSDGSDGSESSDAEEEDDDGEEDEDEDGDE